MKKENIVKLRIVLLLSVSADLIAGSVFLPNQPPTIVKPQKFILMNWKIVNNSNYTVTGFDIKNKVFVDVLGTMSNSALPSSTILPNASVGSSIPSTNCWVSPFVINFKDANGATWSASCDLDTCEGWPFSIGIQPHMITIEWGYPGGRSFKRHYYDIHGNRVQEQPVYVEPKPMPTPSYGGKTGKTGTT